MYILTITNNVYFNSTHIGLIVQKNEIEHECSRDNNGKMDVWSY